MSYSQGEAQITLEPASEKPDPVPEMPKLALERPHLAPMRTEPVSVWHEVAPERPEMPELDPGSPKIAP